MNKRRMIWLALAAGAVFEGALCGIFALFGGFGPCGPVNDISGMLLVLHIPSISVAEVLLPYDTWLELPVVIFVSAVLWSVAAFIIIGVVRTLYGRVTNPVVR